jgi:hypothetical protein
VHDDGDELSARKDRIDAMGGPAAQHSVVDVEIARDAQSQFPAVALCIVSRLVVPRPQRHRDDSGTGRTARNRGQRLTDADDRQTRSPLSRKNLPDVRHAANVVICVERHEDAADRGIPDAVAVHVMLTRW